MIVRRATAVLLLVMTGRSAGFSVGGLSCRPLRKQPWKKLLPLLQRLERKSLHVMKVCENFFLSAAILDPETLYQRSDGGLLFPEVLSKKGIVPGVKPHLKVYTLPGTNGDDLIL